MQRPVTFYQGGFSMLVCSRKVGQEVVIDENIVVQVVRVIGNRVILGFVAPPSVRIDRREVHERRRGEQGTDELGEAEAA
jgi:carbon storage regulator